METDNHPTFGNGKICYIELPSRDINESSFFSKKFLAGISEQEQNEFYNIRKRK